MKKFISKKSIVAAFMAMSIFGSVCSAGPYMEYTNYVDANEHYTGAIIDCRGLGLETAMSPVILNEKGEKLYGDKNLDLDVISRKGMAGYAHGYRDPACSRAGSNPVILRAIGTVNHKMYPVLELGDGLLLKASDLNNHYFEKAAIVFLR